MKKQLLDLIKEQILLISATALISLLFAIVFVPKIQAFFSLQKEIKAQQVKIDKLSNKLNELNSYSKADLQNNFDLFLKVLPAEKDFYPIMTNVKNIFNQEGLLLSDFQFNLGQVSTESAQKNAKTKTENFFSFKLSAFGNIENFQKAVVRLESSIPLLSVDSLTIQNESSSSSAILNNCTGTLSLKSYYMPFSFSLGQAEKDLPKISGSLKALLDKYSVYEYPVEAIYPSEGIVVGKENPFSGY